MQSKKFVFHRRPPDFTPALPLAQGGTALFAPRDISIDDVRMQGIKMEGRAASTLRVNASVLDHVSLANSSFASIVLKDVRLIDCDLANLETRSLSLVRVEVIRCRMTGFRAGKADGQDILISEGDQRYCQFRFSRLRSAEFDSCNFEEADFQGTDLSGARFRKCNLRNAEMTKVKLVNADLRGSSVEELKLNAEDIRGAVVDLSQAMIFASLLRIRIE